MTEHPVLFAISIAAILVGVLAIILHPPYRPHRRNILNPDPGDEHDSIVSAVERELMQDYLPAVPFYDQKADKALAPGKAADALDQMARAAAIQRHEEALSQLHPLRAVQADAGIRSIDWRIEALFSLWSGKVSKEGIAQLLAAGADIGAFTVKRAQAALAAIEAGQPMMTRIHAILDERNEPDVNVSIFHQGDGYYRAILMRGGKRGSALVSDSMGNNAFIDAIIGATARFRPPLVGSFTGAAGGPTDIFEQGPLSTKGEDGGGDEQKKGAG